MNEELKPCPWCGKQPKVSPGKDHDPRNGDAWTRVRCEYRKCGVKPEVTVFAEKGHKRRALKQWNNHAQTNDLALLSLLADIRKAAGDETGKLMQSELVELIARQREECDQMRAAESVGLDISKCSKTTQSLIRMLIERDQRGLAKYGETLDRTDLTHAEWLQHMAEEMLDGAGYALAAKRTA